MLSFDNGVQFLRVKSQTKIDNCKEKLHNQSNNSTSYNSFCTQYFSFIYAKWSQRLSEVKNSCILYFYPLLDWRFVNKYVGKSHVQEFKMDFRQNLAPLWLKYLLANRLPPYIEYSTCLNSVILTRCPINRTLFWNYIS